jgi:F0F1-type ATP synthase membrane subunit b/b'
MKKKGVVEKLLEAPRKLKERAEDYGAETDKEYHELREVPAAKKAEAIYKERQEENEQKFKSGKISEPLYQSRQQKYQHEREKMSKPIEQRIGAGLIDIGKNFQRGLIGPTTKQKIETEYETGAKVAEARYKAGTMSAEDYGTTLVNLETKRRNATIDIDLGITKNKFEGGGVLHEIKFAKPSAPHKAGRGTKVPRTSSKRTPKSRYSTEINFNTPLFGGNKKSRK